MLQAKTHINGHGNSTGLGFSRGRGLKGRGGERYMVKEGARYHREYNFNQRQRGRGCGYDRVRGL